MTDGESSSKIQRAADAARPEGVCHGPDEKATAATLTSATATSGRPDTTPSTGKKSIRLSS